MKDDLMPDVPMIKILSEKDTEDGFVEMVIEYNQDFLDLFDKSTNGQEPTKENLSKFFTEMLEKAIDKVDGYDIN